MIDGRRVFAALGMRVATQMWRRWIRGHGTPRVEIGCKIPRASGESGSAMTKTDYARSDLAALRSHAAKLIE